MLVSCPVVGLLSDCDFGRFKVLRASVWILLVGIVLRAIGFQLYELDVIILEEAIPYITFVIVGLSLALYTCLVKYHLLWIR